MVVYLGNRRIIVGRRTAEPNRVKWAGTVDGRPLPAGTYVLSVGGRDIAGNETPAGKRKKVKVVLRYVELSPGGSPSAAARGSGAREDRAARYTWRLGQRHGSQRGRLLHLRAPTTPGTYRLVVTENGQSATAVVRVHG